MWHETPNNWPNKTSQKSVKRPYIFYQEWELLGQSPYFGLNKYKVGGPYRDERKRWGKSLWIQRRPSPRGSGMELSSQACWPLPVSETNKVPCTSTQRRKLVRQFNGDRSKSRSPFSLWTSDLTQGERIGCIWLWLREPSLEQENSLKK